MKKLFKLLFLLILIIGIFICGNIIYDGYFLYKEKTSAIPIEEKVNSIKDKENYLSYDKIPKDFVNALVSIEDHRFFKHNGVDIQSIFRAIVTDIINFDLVEGGSTITQQLAKNIYYTQDKKFSRKVAEVFTAFDLEKEFSKEEILELYLNIVYFGDGYYGIYDASKGYFDKEPNNLTLNEITLLAGLPNAPSVYALGNDNNLAIERQKMVIDAMVKYDCLSLEEAENINKGNDI